MGNNNNNQNNQKSKFDPKKVEAIRDWLNRDRILGQELNKLDDWLNASWYEFTGWLWAFPKQNEIPKFLKKVDEMRGQGKQIIALLPFDITDPLFQKVIMNRSIMEIVSPEHAPIKDKVWSVCYIGGNDNNRIYRFVMGE